MSRRRKQLPKHVRRHSSGKFRAVITLDGRRQVGKLRSTEGEAADDARRMAGAAALPVTQLETLADGLEAVFAELRASGRRPATITYYRNHARILWRYFDERAPLRTLSAGDVRAYIDRRLSDGVGLVTIWGKELQVLDRICNLAVQRGALAQSPLAAMRRPRLRSVRRDPMPVAVAASIIERVRAWPGVRCAARDADVLTVAMLSGLRRAELARLRPDDVDAETAQLFVDGKTGNRHLPIVGELAAALHRLKLRAGDAELLIGGERAVEKVFARWRERLGEPRLYPRAFRHGFATDHAANGLDPFELRELMGHANLRQTQRYFHSQGQRSRDAMQSIGDRLAGRSRDAEQSAAGPGDAIPATP